MRTMRTGVVITALILAVALHHQAGFSQGAKKPLTEADLIRLINLGVEDDALAPTIRRNGVAFALDPETRRRLQQAGASAAVMAALEAVGKPAADKSPGKARPATTLADVLLLLDAGIDETVIRQRLGATVFQLGADDEKLLKSKGATDELIRFLKTPRGEPNAELTDFAIVLDCSGSMQERTKEGRTKMQAAKQAVAEMIQGLPADLRVTLVLYGHRKEDACNAAEVVRPLGPLGEDGRSQLVELTSRLQPVGATPIALALKVAGVELEKNNAPCGLVLISDGKESCKGDPSAEAAALARRLPISFGVNVVGFDVKGDERRALEEIAQSGKGKYYSADSAEELAAALGKVRAKVEEVHGVPKQREDRKTELAGKQGKAGAFLHTAGLVEPGEFTGKLAMMEGHYYRLAVRKGQEVRAIGQFKKTPYQVFNTVQQSPAIQTFSLTLYDDAWRVVAREHVDVDGNPAGIQSCRAVWTAAADGVLYVGVTASDNHDKEGRPEATSEPRSRGDGGGQLKPSDYTLRLRLEGEPTAAAETRAPVPQLAVAPGAGFERSGDLVVPGAAGGDLKLRETAFYRAKVQKGARLAIAAAIQKPWYDIARPSFTGEIETTYTLSVYDDDQVEIGKKEIKIGNNPPDAQVIELAVTAPLSGYVYVSVSGIVTGPDIYPNDFQPRPGHVAVQIAPGQPIAQDEP